MIRHGAARCGAVRMVEMSTTDQGALGVSERGSERVEVDRPATFAADDIAAFARKIEEVASPQGALWYES